MNRNEGDTRETRFYRVTKNVVEYAYILASSQEDALAEAEKGYGIATRIPIHTIETLTEQEWFAGIEGADNENGDWYNGDGTAMFYNDEYHELYRLDVDKRMWFPVDDVRDGLSDSEPYMFLDDENDEDPIDPFEW